MSPAIAQVSNVQQLQSQLQNSVCASDWNNAIAAIQQLIGSAEITPDYRQQLVAYRSQLDGYRASRVEYARSSDPRCQSTSTVIQPSSQQASGQSFDWDRALASVESARPQTTTPSTSGYSQPVAAAPVTASGVLDEQFWAIFSGIGADYPRVLESARSVEPATIVSYARMICPTVQAHGSLQVVLRQQAASDVPASLLAAINVAAINAYCPEHSWML